ncbi:hypothetical protein LQF12_08350 [Ruania suaedae]|uniref:hypothetical protein n=1 Tax=Ruania suaedae TaxID=2897774 RepID=UPI001E2D68E3|nr:hypothetical protein [Ruania suaedae]UFU01547.1 hypothetical protein LQF12_08350 [Ruania suaedae]
MFVVTADQNASRRHRDLVPETLDHLHRLHGRDPAVALAFERTVGDEIQGVLTTAAGTLRAVLALHRRHEWSVGVGVGAVDLPLAESARASSGAAFLHAREAVERARGRTVPVPMAVTAGQAAGAAEAEALLQLVAGVVRRRTDAGWEAIDLIETTGCTAREAATALGVSPQAVSARLRAAMWDEERGVHPLAERLLASLDETGRMDS